MLPTSQVPETPTPVWRRDEHVTDPGEGGVVGDDSRERRLTVLGQHGVGARSGDRSLDHRAFASLGPVGLVREPGLHPVDIDAPGVSAQLVAIAMSLGHPQLLLMSFLTCREPWPASQNRPALPVAGGVLERARELEQLALTAPASHELHADRQPLLGEAARHGQGGQPGHRDARA
jgi:hypothetical protein